MDHSRGHSCRRRGVDRLRQGDVAGPEANMPLASDEFAWTVEAEQDYLAEMAAADNSLVLLAMAGDRIIGELSLRGGQRRAIATRRCWVCPSIR